MPVGGTVGGERDNAALLLEGSVCAEHFTVRHMLYGQYHTTSADRGCARAAGSGLGGTDVRARIHSAWQHIHAIKPTVDGSTASRAVKGDHVVSPGAVRKNFRPEPNAKSLPYQLCCGGFSLLSSGAQSV